MRLRISALACLCILQLTSAVAQAQEWWAQAPTSQQSGHGHMVRDRAGNVLMAAPYGGGVTKFRASDGAVLWNAPAMTFGQLAIDSSDNAYASALTTRFDSQGRAIAVLVVTKISNAGTIVWTSQTDIGFVSEHGSAGPIVLGSNGSLYVVGTAGNSSQSTAPATLVRMSTSTGSVQLPKVSLGGVVDFGSDMYLNKLRVDSSNNVYWASTAGLTRFSPTLANPVTWSSHLPVRGITVSGGFVYVTGPQAFGSSYAMYVAKLTTGLSTSWRYTFQAQFRNDPYPPYAEISSPGNPTTYGGNAVAVDSAGNVYAAGDAVSPDGSFTGGTLAKLSANGQLLWSQQIGQSGLDSSCFDVAVSPNSKVVVSCTDMQHDNQSSTAIAVISDLNGNQLQWFANDGPGGEDDAFDHLLIGASGTLYLLDESGYLVDIGNNQTTQVFVPTIFAYPLTGL